MPSAECRSRGRTPLDPDELERMAQMAWREHGIVVLRPRQIVNALDRQAVKNLATQLYGSTQAKDEEQPPDKGLGAKPLEMDSR